MMVLCSLVALSLKYYDSYRCGLEPRPATVSQVFSARLDEVQKSLCTTPGVCVGVGVGVGVGIHIYVKLFLKAHIF